jgi:predicted acyltransferase
MVPRAVSVRGEAAPSETLPGRDGMDRLQGRSEAIDVMRGMTVALMIVVNMSISDKYSYAPLLHAVWHGLTLTDIVFPTFMFVVGCAMSFSLDKLRAQGDAAVLKKAFRRAALIFLCGYLLYWYPFLMFDASGSLVLRPLETTRIPGVLQRVALGYLVAVLVLQGFGRRGVLVLCALALLAYWGLLSAYGDLTLQGNAVLCLDRFVLGEAHLYGGEGMPFDPEGILSTLPAVVNVLAGVLAGRFVREKGASFETIAQLMLAGAACIVAALCWSAWLPFNKKLWTSSYVLVTTGIDLMLLAALVDAVDRRGLRGAWTRFFGDFGRNTLFIYLFSEVIMATMGLVHIGEMNLFDWLYFNVFRGGFGIGDKPASLVYALSFMLGCWGVAHAMDRRGIYIRL